MSRSLAFGLLLAACSGAPEALDASTDGSIDSPAGDGGATDLDASTADAGPAPDAAVVTDCPPGQACASPMAVCTSALGPDCTAECACLGDAWLCAWERTPACERALCPAAPPLTGEVAYPPYAHDPEGRVVWPLECTYGEPACPLTCRMVPSLTGYQWHCYPSAAPGCGSDCPADRPLRNPDGLPSSCAGHSGADCGYATDGYGCEAYCTCRAAGASELWVCDYDCACPSVEPADGSACGSEQDGLGCQFGSRLCLCRGIADGVYEWDCRTIGACPSAPPVASTTCDPSAISSCSYDAPPYCGACRCPSGNWICDPSTCDMCPPAAPPNRSSCAGLSAQTCAYPSGAHCTCRADPATLTDLW
ncbi:MAG: hypothetical protein K8H88_05840, partial [Sandaracinaceae bacterium]|nr:hypothetical protein [Sandaracinaceae bacterium]